MFIERKLAEFFGQPSEPQWIHQRYAHQFGQLERRNRVVRAKTILILDRYGSLLNPAPLWREWKEELWHLARLSCGPADREIARRDVLIQPPKHLRERLGCTRS